MPKRKRGGYIFQRHKNDHPPPHVHIFKDGREIAKWDTQNWKLMKGKIEDQKILEFLEELIKKGEL